MYTVVQSDNSEPQACCWLVLHHESGIVQLQDLGGPTKSTPESWSFFQSVLWEWWWLSLERQSFKLPTGHTLVRG